MRPTRAQIDEALKVTADVFSKSTGTLQHHQYLLQVHKVLIDATAEAEQPQESKNDGV